MACCSWEVQNGQEAMQGDLCLHVLVEFPIQNVGLRPTAGWSSQHEYHLACWEEVDGEDQYVQPVEWAHSVPVGYSVLLAA